MPSRFEKEIEEIKATNDNIQRRIEELKIELKHLRGHSIGKKVNLLKRIECLQDEQYNLAEVLHMMYQYND